jgi:hypothetical protein
MHAHFRFRQRLLLNAYLLFKVVVTQFSEKDVLGKVKGRIIAAFAPVFPAGIDLIVTVGGF